MIVEGVSNGDEPLHCDDYQPDHGHGDGDVLNGVGEVWDYSVEPLIVAHGDMANYDIVHEVHENEKTVDNSQNSEVLVEMAKKGRGSPSSYSSQNYDNGH